MNKTLTKYTIYSIYNNGRHIEEHIMLVTSDADKAIEWAKAIADRDKLELNRLQHSVEIRFNEDFEAGTYELLNY